MGQVYRLDGARAIRIPSDANGRLKLQVGRSCQVVNRREILGLVWPEEVTSEAHISTLDKIEAAEMPREVEVTESKPKRDEPAEEVEKPKRSRSRRRRDSLD